MMLLSVSQRDEAHEEVPTSTVMEVPLTPKFPPRIVRIAPDVVGALRDLANESTGASYVKWRKPVPIRELTCNDVDNAAPTPGWVRQVICVAVVQLVVAHVVSPTDPVSDKSTAPKFIPARERYVPPLAGVLGYRARVTEGLSYEKLDMRVPMFWVITLSVSLPPVPWAAPHRMLVPVLHETVEQTVAPPRALIV